MNETAERVTPSLRRLERAAMRKYRARMRYENWLNDDRNKQTGCYLGHMIAAAHKALDRACAAHAKAQRKENGLWVVEMWNPPRNRYEPTVDARLDRAEGREKLAEWRIQCQYDRFRLRPYVRAKAQRRRK